MYKFIPNFFLLLFLFTNTLFIVAQTPDIFVSNFQNAAISRFDGETGAFEGNFVAPGSGGLIRPQKVFFHPHTQHLLVTGFLNNAIKMYDGETGDFLGDFSTGYTLDSPTKMILGPDSLLYVSQWDGKVVRFNLDGSFADEFTDINIPAGLGMTWDVAGNLYVAGWGTDGFDGKVHRFDAQGNSLGVFIDSDQLDGPVGIWQEDTGDFLVVDWRKGAVLRFDDNGTFIETFIQVSEAIEGHAFDPDGNIYLCNVQVNKVTRYQEDGIFNDTFISETGLAGPNDIEFGPMVVTSATKEPDASKVFDLQVAPNPFVQQLTIQFKLPISEQVRLEILDEKGNIIAFLKNEKMSVGKHEVIWNRANLPSGIYMVLLKIGKELVTKRLVGF